MMRFAVSYDHTSVPIKGIFEVANVFVVFSGGRCNQGSFMLHCRDNGEDSNTLQFQRLMCKMFLNLEEH